MILSGLFKDSFAASRLLKFSTELPFIHANQSYQIFSLIENPNGFICNTMMKGYMQSNSPCKAIWVYKLMLESNVAADNYTYPILFQSCSVRLAEFDGKCIQNHVLKMGFDSDVYIQNTLINMYSVCGNLGAARKVFDDSSVLDLVSWNSMLAGYVLVGNVEEAKDVYDRMPERNNEMYGEALILFKEMNASGIMVDEVVMLSVLSACSRLLVVMTGKLVHCLAVKVGIETYVNLQNALIHMYSSCEEVGTAQKLFSESCWLDQISWNSMISGYVKCGEFEKARALFDSMPDKDNVSWSAMISGYAQQDKFTETLVLFQEMQIEGTKPDETILVSVISACTHLAALDQGCVEDALEVFRGLEEKGVSTWNALILGLAMNGETGERIGRKLVELHPDHDGFNVLLSNIYASKGNWVDVLEVRGMMRQHGVVKTPGCSMIEAHGRVHEFLAGDKTHPQNEDIEHMLDEMAKKLKLEGYAPDTREVSLDIDEEEKETTLFRHSEKLAIAFGLIAIDPPTPIRIVKNLRICNDCHTAAKLISKAFNREIVVRDRHLFHHFKQGSCSCMDYCNHALQKVLTHNGWLNFPTAEHEYKKRMPLNPNRRILTS
ncbi:hypothetical protein OIU77_018346 [Salix suchowensis]|uniref:DYW domain-containing protein n=1 Tax=Salix suchowensis TaxID=1278906 RepID=A0ABQ9CGG2_9ROSI|nr:hypothetical protein OIU77_018346 [Salix suchowensis]